MTKKTAARVLKTDYGADSPDLLALAVECWRRAFLEYLGALGQGNDTEFQARARWRLLRRVVIALRD